MWAEVVVDHPAGRRSRSLSQTFTYHLPVGLSVEQGVVVRVPFGPRQALGVVLGLRDSPPEFETRPIAAVIDGQPWLTPIQIEFARWLADYYCATLWDAIQLMLPPGLQRTPIVALQSTPNAAQLASLSLAARAVVELLIQCKRLSADALRARLRRQGFKESLPELFEALALQGIILRTSEVGARRVRPKQERLIRVVAEGSEMLAALASSGRAFRRAAAIQRLHEAIVKGEGDTLPLRRFCSEVGCTTQVVTELARRGLVRLETREVSRSPFDDAAMMRIPAADLTPNQQEISEQLAASLHSSRPGVFLLHGVAASGKTEIYLQLVESVLARGRRAIILVPEIALTPQAIQRYAGRFAGRVGVIHSQLSPGEHYDEWRRIRDGRVDVVVGPRSALFAPIRDLGAIVVDEEHEWSYKQEATPHYHARDAAIKLGDLASAVVVLGSATPDVVTYARAQSGQYRLLRLSERISVHQPGGVAPARIVAGVDAPSVAVVDLRQELKRGNRTIFSWRLREAIRRALSREEQVILFLNRRGAATFVMCRNCGAVLRCRRCDASLVYHSVGDVLVCHLCNFRRETPDVCPTCRSSRIKFFGVGTQRVEFEVRQAFPQARVLRWDRDVARTRRAHEGIFRQFQAHEADILVGTQLVAKGLDLPGVTVIGVVSADTTLHLPDYRTVERTFQLLMQVAGRAGRGANAGQVIIQTYTPDHYCIQAASRHDYEAFVTRELEFRRSQGYPPFSQLALLLCARNSERAAEQEANRLAEALRGEIARQGLPEVEVIGPAPSYRQRIRGRYRWQVLVRGQQPWIGAALRSISLPAGCSIDVDPVSVL